MASSSHLFDRPATQSLTANLALHCPRFLSKNHLDDFRHSSLPKQIVFTIYTLT